MSAMNKRSQVVAGSVPGTVEFQLIDPDEAPHIGVAAFNPFEDEVVPDKVIVKDLAKQKEIKLDILKDRLRYFVARGIHSPSIILKKIYNPDEDSLLSRADILAAFNSVLEELRRDLGSRDVRMYFLTRVSEFDHYQMELDSIISSSRSSTSDKINAINASNRLSAERLEYMQKLGVKVHLGEDGNGMSLTDGNPIEMDDDQLNIVDEMKTLNEKAAEIEVDYNVD